MRAITPYMYSMYLLLRRFHSTFEVYKVFFKLTNNKHTFYASSFSRTSISSNQQHIHHHHQIFYVFFLLNLLIPWSIKPHPMANMDTKLFCTVQFFKYLNILLFFKVVQRQITLFYSIKD